MWRVRRPFLSFRGSWLMKVYIYIYLEQGVLESWSRPQAAYYFKKQGEGCGGTERKYSIEVDNRIKSYASLGSTLGTRSSGCLVVIYFLGPAVHQFMLNP